MGKRRANSKTTDAPRDPAEFQREFLSRMGGTQQFQELFEHLPGVYFFVKDRRSRMVCASPPFWEHLGARSEAEIIGRTDHEFFPQHAADHFRRDDELVMTTGRPLIGRVELWYNAQRVLDWFITNKLPVRDAEGRIIGVMGIVRSYEGQRRSLHPVSLINSTIEHIREHRQQRLTVQDLATRAKLSPRQLHRRFREVFGLSVREFLLRTRVQSASDALLSSDLPIARIAVEFGFCDQSAFTQLFRKYTGLTPRQFRQRYRRPGAVAEPSVSPVDEPGA